MLNRRDFLIGTTALAAMATTIGSATGQSAEAVKLAIKTHFSSGDVDAMQTVVKKMMDERSSLVVDLVQGGFTEHYAQIYNAVVAGIAPDIATCHDYGLVNLSPALFDLEKTPIGNVFEAAKCSINDFDDQALRFAQYNGVRYGFPVSHNGLQLYYNKKIFRDAGLDPDAPPTTRAEFEAACDKIKAIGKLPFNPVLAAAPRWIRRIWFQFYWGTGGELYDADQATFNNQGAREALQYMVDIVHGRGWNEPGTDGNNQFLAGELGMCFNGTWFYLTAEKSGLDYGCGQIPVFFEKQAAYAECFGFVLPKQPADDQHLKSLQGSAEWLQLFLANADLWAVLSGGLPSYKPALANPELLQSKTWEVSLRHFNAMAQAGNTIIQPIHPKMSKINDALEPYLQAAYNGTSSVDDAINGADKAVGEVLAA